MAYRARVFVDTATVRHSIRSRTLLSPKSRTLNWGGSPHEVEIYESKTFDPTDKVDAQSLRIEIDALSKVARRAKDGEVQLLWQFETQLKFLGQYKIPGGGQSELAEAGISLVQSPIEYCRLITPLPGMLGETWRSMQVSFLRSVTDKRFLELQRLCGANEGSEEKRSSQLKDAFHIWSAEECGASHFMTTDLKLVNRVRSFKPVTPRVNVVKPSELLEHLGTDSY